MRYQAHALNAAGTAGTGTITIQADSEDAARAAFAAIEGMTLDQLADAGLTIYLKEI